jgi:hypothetical protein
MQVACPGGSRRLRPGSKGLGFSSELAQHVPPKRFQLIRRYGLYASSSKRLPAVCRLRRYTGKAKYVPSPTVKSQRP